MLKTSIARGNRLSKTEAIRSWLTRSVEEFKRLTDEKIDEDLKNVRSIEIKQFMEK